MTTEWRRYLESNKQFVKLITDELASLLTTDTSTATTIASLQASIASLQTAVAQLGRGRFKVHLNDVDYGLVASDFNTIIFTHKDIDTDNWYNTANGRYTPKEAGLYLFVLNIFADTDATGIPPNAIIFKNGVDVQYGTFYVEPTAGQLTGAICLGILQMNGTADYVTASVFPSTGVTILSGLKNSTNFAGWRIGA